MTTPNLGADGQYFALFTDRHHRQLPRLTAGPFRYKTHAAGYPKKSIKMAKHLPRRRLRFDPQRRSGDIVPVDLSGGAGDSWGCCT